MKFDGGWWVTGSELSGFPCSLFNVYIAQPPSATFPNPGFLFKYKELKGKGFFDLGFILCGLRYEKPLLGQSERNI